MTDDNIPGATAAKNVISTAPIDFVALAEALEPTAHETAPADDVETHAPAEDVSEPEFDPLAELKDIAVYSAVDVIGRAFFAHERVLALIAKVEGRV